MPTREVDLGFRPRPWQLEVFLHLCRFSVLVVHRRGGKTLLAIMRLIDAALKIKRERGRYAYIAPELKQAKGIAWDYLKSFSLKVPGAICNESELWVQFPNGARIRLFGADNPNSLRGYYFDGVVMDEVAQMKPDVWGEIIMPALSDRQGWALFIGTPHGLNLFSDLYHKALKAPDQWYAKLYTYLDTQSLPEEEIERMRATMTDKQFRQEMLCDFGAEDDDTLIPLQAARDAAGRKLEPVAYEFAPKVIGVDVAWTGGDRSVIFKRQGLMSWPPIIRKGLPERSLAGEIARLHDEWKPDAVFIDNTGGYGGEVVSRLQEGGYLCEGVKFSAGASDEKFRNLRAEMWFKMAEWVKSGASIPDSEELIRELTCPKYDNNNAANKLTLQSKDEIKDTLGFSPDIADALALTFAYPVFSIDPFTPQAGPVQADLASYSPFAKRRR